MKSTHLNRRDKLPSLLKLALFTSSYCPLFLIIVCKQISVNIEYLYFDGFTRKSIILFLSNFGIAFLLLAFTIFGIFGICAFMHNMNNSLEKSGYDYKISKIQNKNHESIGYIATYLFPFMFQSFSSVTEIISFLVLLIVIYIVYTHSTLIIVNPILNLRYSLYNIEYVDIRSNRVREGTFIVDCHYVEQDDIITAKKWGTNLYYGKIKELHDE